MTRPVVYLNFLVFAFALSVGLMLLSPSGLCHASERTRKDAGIQRLIFPNKNGTITTRKLLQSAEDGDANRIHFNPCSKDDIVINQGPTTSLPNGIPMYLVEIVNICNSGCSISNIHLTCGWFSSARLINPRLFKRLAFDDCLVNNGEPLLAGQSLSFQYANTFSYPLSVSTVKCWW